jgi:hypothetical protein
MRQRWLRLLIGVTVAAVSTAFVLAAPPQTRALPSIDIRVGTAPVPIPGSDGRTHFVYELRVTGPAQGDLQLERLEVFGDPAVEPLVSYGPAELEGRVRPESPAGYRGDQDRAENPTRSAPRQGRELRKRERGAPAFQRGGRRADRECRRASICLRFLRGPRHHDRGRGIR